MDEINITSFAVEEEQTPCPRRSNQRRSTFFRRRSILQTQDEDGSKVYDTQNPSARVVDRIENAISGDSKEMKNEVTSFDLRKYIDDLKQERKTWRQTLLERKRQHKSVLKQVSNMQRKEQDVDLNALSESERNFLLVRPNYEQICEKAKKLSSMAVETEIMNKHVVHLHERCMLRAKKKLNDLTTRIIKMVD